MKSSHGKKNRFRLWSLLFTYRNYYEKVIKNNKDINISNYTFPIPNNWIWCSLSQISRQITDGTHKTPNYQKTGIPFISIVNISTGKYDNNPKYISIEEHLQLIKRCNPKLNDILLCRIGTLGKPFINTLNFEYSIFVSLALIKLVDKTLTDYIKLVLDSPNIYSYIDKIKVGGGTHTFKINIEDLSTFPIPLPPKDEQIKIVERLNTIITRIDNLIY
ncbi:restriction endonuclease subunit S [Mycoplasmopsis arginini]|uniref:restriction endonuclease subunit S n=1 Tax=Mycoplasmopsis arginini TaxID=2094 RepID=UPI00296237DF|nr:restriction endonuclease subunit S [Mycoplasmopsis arginini]